MKILIKQSRQEFSFLIPKILPTEGIQKVRGFSKGYHMNNSIRLGIRKENDYIVFYNYCHIKGKQISQRIPGQWKEGRIVHCILTFEKNKATALLGYINCLKYKASIEFKPIKTCPIGYELNSYAEEDFTNKKINFNIQFMPINESS